MLHLTKSQSSSVAINLNTLDEPEKMRLNVVAQMSRTKHDITRYHLFVLINKYAPLRRTTRVM
jgi:hypothetical protein